MLAGNRSVAVGGNSSSAACQITFTHKRGNMSKSKAMSAAVYQYALLVAIRRGSAGIFIPARAVAQQPRDYQLMVYPGVRSGRRADRQK